LVNFLNPVLYMFAPASTNKYKPRMRGRITVQNKNGAEGLQAAHW